MTSRTAGVGATPGARNSHPRGPLLPTAVLLPLLLVGCSGSDGPASARAAGTGRPPTASSTGQPAPTLPVPASAQAARVVRHVDGDTLVLTGEGPGPLPSRPTRTRLLHIDTPEVFERPECYGTEAAERTAGLLPVGAAVRVQADVDPEDRFGRALLLVWDAEGRNVQEVLLREGAARVLALGTNRRGLRELREAERQARSARAGLWGAC